MGMSDMFDEGTKMISLALTAPEICMLHLSNRKSSLKWMKREARQLQLLDFVWVGALSPSSSRVHSWSFIHLLPQGQTNKQVTLFWTVDDNSSYTCFFLSSSNSVQLLHLKSRFLPLLPEQSWTYPSSLLDTKIKPKIIFLGVVSGIK